jgi:hypothetical protein
MSNPARFLCITRRGLRPACGITRRGLRSACGITRRGLRPACGLAIALLATLARAADAHELPTGPAYASPWLRPRDDPGRPPACSFRYPVCVHADPGVAASVILGALADFEHASSAVIDTLGLPRPMSDGALGRGPAFDVYLVAPTSPSLGGASLRIARDDPDPGSFDRASAFALLRSDAPAGCVRRNLAARALAGAVGWAIDAAETPTVRESNAAYVAELVVPCGAVTAELVDDFQAHPERGFLTPSEAGGDAAAMALPWYLDQALGIGGPARIPFALAAIAVQKTPAGALRWQNEPDLFDALRGTLKARKPPLSLDDLWLEFATARLFMGTRDDGLHFPESAFLGSFGRIRFEWSLPYASLPRRVSPDRPIEPSGATYVWIDLGSAPPTARLAFRVEWEPPVLFRWALLRIRPDGSEASRVLIVPQQKSTSAERNLEDLEGLAGVAVVGVNIGDLRPDDPFDPDEAPYEPHGYVLTVASPR